MTTENGAVSVLFKKNLELSTFIWILIHNFLNSKWKKVVCRGTVFKKNQNFRFFTSGGLQVIVDLHEDPLDDAITADEFSCD